MFTGFASENTPAIQVWDFFRAFASTSATRSVSLSDDCAPIQVFRTGATTSTSINVFLPSCFPEGKRLTIVNQKFGSATQTVTIRSSDVSGEGSSLGLYTVNQGAMLEFVYTKQAITFGATSGTYQSGWLCLNMGSASAFNYGAVALGNANSATGTDSSVFGGNNNLSSSANSTIVGGGSCSSSGPYSSVLGGFGNTASGLYSSVVGGTSNTANSSYTAAIGGSAATTRSIIGNFVTAASDTPVSGNAGSQQLGRLLLGRQTTDGTPTVLRSNTATASTTNQVILPNNSAYAFEGTVIANVTGGGDTSGWKFEGAIKRGANAASTTLVAAVTPTVIAQDAGASAWVVAVTADTTNGGIAVTVTGAAATTIRWVCKIETTEVTY